MPSAAPSDAAARRTLFLLFLLSGGCGLVYQVLWVRRLTLIFGATTYAMATVLAVFMGGLALGSALARTRADRVPSPLKAYARLEVGVAVSALAVLPALTAAERLVQAALSPEASPGTSLAVQFVVCFAILVVPTTCMGATLPILSRWVSGAFATRGRDLGRLYAVNTLGACLGTLFAGFLAVEFLGIRITNAGAAATNILVAWMAWRLAGRSAVAAPGEDDGPAVEPAGGPPIAVLLALGFGSGLFALGHEVAWTRLLGLVLLNTTYAFTAILATVIFGIGAGSLIGAWAADRTDRPDRVFGLTQIAVGLGAVGMARLLDVIVAQQTWLLDAHALPFARAQLVSLGVCVLLLLPSSLAMGAGYPLLAKAVTRGASVGRRVADLYSVNTVGGILGSVASGFVLLPTLGVFGGLTVLAGGNIALGIAAGWPGRGRALGGWAAGSVVAVGLFAAGSGGLDLETVYRARLPEGSTILAIEETATSTVMVADHSEPRVRRIWIQSCWVAGTGGTHKMLGHLSMLHGDGRDRAVGIAFGTGQSFGSALAHGLKRLDCVDLDRGMVELGGEWFKAWNHDLLAQPGTHVYVQDGRSFLGRSRGVYDAVLMEPLQPWYAGAVNLYTREFYEAAHAALKPRGTLTQWLPLDDVTPGMMRSVVGTFADVFPRTWLYLDNFDLWLVGSKDDAPVDLAGWDRAFAAPGVGDELESIDYGDVASILSTVVVGPEDMQAFVGDALRLTDDRPFMEFEAPRTMQGRHFPANVDALLSATRDPLGSFRDAPAAPLPAVVRSGEVAAGLARANVAVDAGRSGGAVALLAPLVERAPGVARLLASYREATAHHATALVAGGRPDAAAVAYRAHLERDPAFAGGRLNLAIVLAGMGDMPGARAHIASVIEDPELADRARAVLQALPPLFEESLTP